MSKILIIGEHEEGALTAATAKAVRCAQDFQPEVLDIAVFVSEGGDEIAQRAASLEGVTNVFKVTHSANEHPVAAILAPQAVALAEGYSHLLVGNSTFGKDLMPRVAALLGAPQVTDIMQVEGDYVFQRPIYAGNAINTVEAPSDRIVVATVRGASYPSAGKRSSPASVTDKQTDAEIPEHTRFVDREVHKSDRPDLATAKRVVSGGRGVGSAENFEIIFRFADKLGAGVGASRAAVDAGYVPNDMQVGQTGKIISPELYIAIGISGAIQHWAGIKDAGTIVAINKDEEAPIFEVADYGLVADLFEAIPELEKELEKG